MALEAYEERAQAAPQTVPPAPPPEGAPTGGELLVLRNIRRHFQTKRHDTLALDNVSLSISEGEFVCLVGPSGCGKSTLLNIVAGLDHPDEGEALFDGRSIGKPGRERIVVFQEPALYPWLNVRANVELGLKIAGRGKDERKQLADRYIQLVNLRRFEKAYIHELSGGMKQRAQLSPRARRGAADAADGRTVRRARCANA